MSSRSRLAARGAGKPGVPLEDSLHPGLEMPSHSRLRDLPIRQSATVLVKVVLEHCEDTNAEDGEKAASSQWNKIVSQGCRLTPNGTHFNLAHGTQPQ